MHFKVTRMKEEERGIIGKSLLMGGSLVVASYIAIKKGGLLGVAAGSLFGLI